MNSRRALVTGATGGVGAAVAHALAPSYEILLGGRDVRVLAKLAATLPVASPWPVDLTVDNAVAEAAGKIDHLDVLVHSAGVWEPGSIRETAPETWRHVLNVNLCAVANLTRLLLPVLREANGVIVLINSTAGVRASPRRGAYAASKFALRAFADTLRSEEEANGVRVTSLYLGRVATDMQLKVRDDEHGHYEPNDYLSPESVARAVAHAVDAPPDAHVGEVVLTPRNHGLTSQRTDGRTSDFRK